MAKTMEKPEVLVEDELIMVDEVEQVEDDVEIKEDARSLDAPLFESWVVVIGFGGRG